MHDLMKPSKTGDIPVACCLELIRAYLCSVVVGGIVIITIISSVSIVVFLCVGLKRVQAVRVQEIKHSTKSCLLHILHINFQGLQKSKAVKAQGFFSETIQC